MPRILIVDNELSLVADLEQYLSDAGHQVVGNAISGRQALMIAQSTAPDLVLIEVKLAGEMDGITAAIRIRDAFNVPIIFLTWYGDKRTLGEAKWARPAAYVLKPFQSDQISEAIDFALRGNPTPNPYQLKPTTDSYVNLINGHHTPDGQEAGTLTPAEIRIVNLIIQRRRTADIADELKLEKCTVHWHQKNIRRKMGLTGRKESLMSYLTMNGRP
jgi:DNA-binding NarL/FixJ family response regulator